MVRHRCHPGHIARPGGRPYARRGFAALVAVLLGIGQPLAADGGDPQVTVRGDEGRYTVAARFTVPHSAAAALAVLADFERIPEFMPGVRASRVLDRTAGRLLVEQVAEARVLLFSKRVHLLLEVREAAGVLRFRDVCGKSFVHYQGSWRVADQADGAQISYELTAEPAFDVPGFLLARLLRRDAREMIERLRAEIAARAEDAVAPGSR